MYSFMKHTSELSHIIAYLGMLESEVRKFQLYKHFALHSVTHQKQQKA